MLRERRRHANFKPNRKLDPKSSRSTIYENEELRLRTININAEVERGQSDIKKLRKENDQLRREIWALRDEYDRLDKLLQASRNGRNILNQLNNPHLDSDADGPRCDSCNQSEESNCSSCCDTCDEDNDDDEPSQPTTFDNFPKVKEKLHVNFDHLSIVSEETFSGSCENPSSPNLAENTIDAIKEESEYKPDACSALIDFQSIVPPLAYFENLCYEDIGPNLDATGEIQYHSEQIQPKLVPTVTEPNKMPGTTAIGWDFSDKLRPFADDAEHIDRKGPDIFVQNGIQKSVEPIYAEVRKKPASIFQVGGNLDDLLQNIEHLSQDIVQIQQENQKITTKYNLVKSVSETETANDDAPTESTIQQQSKPYRSEVNLMLCFDGSNQKIIPVENDGSDQTALVTANQDTTDTPPPYVPKPMNLLPTTLPYVASEDKIPTSDTKCFERFTETKDCNYLETIRRKIFPKKTDAVKDKLIDKRVKLKSDNGTDVEKTFGNQVNKKAVIGTEVVDTKRKSRRVSLFNGKKNEATAAATTAKNQRTNADQSPQQSRSKHHHHKVRRRHSDGNLRSRRGSHESMAFGRCSSRESSVSLRSQKTHKNRKSSKTKGGGGSSSSASNANLGKIPWFGCWGNECLY